MATRTVLIEGTVDLEPENPTATPSTRAYLGFEVHTLWISNSGPGAERVRYQVGLIPG